ESGRIIKAHHPVKREHLFPPHPTQANPSPTYHLPININRYSTSFTSGASDLQNGFHRPIIITASPRCVQLGNLCRVDHCSKSQFTHAWDPIVVLLIRVLSLTTRPPQIGKRHGRHMWDPDVDARVGPTVELNHCIPLQMVAMPGSTERLVRHQPETLSLRSQSIPPELTTLQTPPTFTSLTIAHSNDSFPRPFTLVPSHFAL
ncbi:hypothetical protein MJO28_007279, partial [Puccinia striiformis f. sp. tritici]